MNILGQIIVNINTLNYYKQVMSILRGHIFSIGLVIVFVAALIVRFPLLWQLGKDYVTFQKAVTDFSLGINPYIDTLRSFQDKDLTSGGYAYFPGLLYTFYTLYVLSFISHFPVELLWKMPNLLAEFGVAIFIVKILKSKGHIVTLLAVGSWLFNPYLLMDQRYTYTDAIPVFFMLLSVYYLGKEDIASGVFFALSVLFKPFPLFALPLYILLSKNKLGFMSAGFIVAVLFSIPFMSSLENFLTYLKGSLLVHEGRSVTGRPFLFYISYFYKIEFIQVVPIKVYTLLATFFGWFAICVLYLFKKARNPYTLATVGLISFYAFTPVLNRTYLLWFMPFFCIALAAAPRRSFFYVGTVLFYAFYSWYLWQWTDGFHIIRPW